MHEHHTLWTANVVLTWRLDPVKFVRDVFKVEPDEWQIEALRHIAKHPRLAMKACKGPGKSCVLAWIGWWYMVTHKDCKVIATSITGENLADGLWSEMATWYLQSKMLQSLFTYQKKSIRNKKRPDVWWMVPRTFSKNSTESEQANTLAGKHAKNMLFLIDESGDIPIGVKVAAEAAMANEGDQKIAVAGNPTSLDGMLYHIYKNEQHLWKVIEISSAPDDPKRASRVTLEYAQGLIDQWGWDHPYVKVNVRGMFPPKSFNTLLGPDEVHAAAKRQISVAAYSHMEKRLGVDVALFGDDDSAIFPRQGLLASVPIILKNEVPSGIGNRVMMARTKWQEDPTELIKIYVDDTGGYGSGVTDFLNLNSVPGVMGINFSSKADEVTFMNKRAEIWWRMAEWIKKGGCIPNNVNLIRELTEPFYFFHNGTLGIEPKKDIKSRLGRSPDAADALALTFSQQDMASMFASTHLNLPYASKIGLPGQQKGYKSRMGFKRRPSGLLVPENYYTPIAA